jgi:hypothetical protein
LVVAARFAPKFVRETLRSTGSDLDLTRKMEGKKEEADHHRLIPSRHQSWSPHLFPSGVSVRLVDRSKMIWPFSLVASSLASLN